MVRTCWYVPVFASVPLLKYKQGHLLIVNMKRKYSLGIFVCLFVLALVLNILSPVKDS